MHTGFASEATSRTLNFSPREWLGEHFQARVKKTQKMPNFSLFPRNPWHRSSSLDPIPKVTSPRETPKGVNSNTEARLGSVPAFSNHSPRGKHATAATTAGRRERNTTLHGREHPEGRKPRSLSLHGGKTLERNTTLHGREHPEGRKPRSLSLHRGNT